MARFTTHLQRALVAAAALLPAVPAAAAPAAETEATEVVEVSGVPANPGRPSLNLDLKPLSLTMQDLTFPSGLRVIFQRDINQPIVAITSVTDHGASDDPLGKEGIAHLVEHLWFRSEHGTLPKTWDLLESEMGCSLNAFTQYDITAYMTVCASHNLEAMMKLEALRIADPIAKVTEDMVTTEIEVVRNEIRMRAENYNIPFFTVWEYINKHTFPEEHPYHRPMAGDHTSIRNIVLADIQAFTDAYYHPETTTIMVVGDLPDASFNYLLHLMVSTFDLKLLDENLTDDDIRRAPRPTVENPDPENPEDWYLIPMNPANNDEVLSIESKFTPRRDEFTGLIPVDPQSKEMGVYEGPVEHPTVAISWTAPAGYQGDDTLMQVAGSLVSTAVSQGVTQLQDRNINTRFDPDKGLSPPGCGALPSKRISTIICSATLKNVDDLDDKDLQRVAERAADRMLDQVINVVTGWQENELTQKAFEANFSYARNSFLASLFNQSDLYAAVGAGRATSTAQHAHFTGSPRYFTDSMNEVLRLQAFQIAEFVDTYLKRGRSTSVLINPLDRDEVAIVSGDTEGSGGHFRGGGEEAILNPSIPVEDITPAFLRELITLPDLSAITDFKMSNGLRVVIVKHGSVPLVQAQLIAYGAGSTYDVDGSMGFAKQFLLHDGDFRASNDPGSFSPPLDPLRFAGGWHDGGGSLTDTIGIRGSSGNLDGELWMLRERLSSTKPYLSGKSSYLSYLKRSLRKNWYDPDWHVSRMWGEHLNPDHILTDPLTWAEVEALKKHGNKQVAEFIAQVWQPANTVLLITGDVDPNEAKELAVRYFGGWRPANGVEPVKAPAIPGPNAPGDLKVMVIDDEGKTQTQVTLVCPLKPAAETPSAPHQLLGDITRMTLFAELREEAGVVYSPQAAAITQPGGAAFMYMTAAIQNDSAVFALSRYRAFLDKASEGRLAERDLRLKQLARASNYVLGQQSLDQMANRLTGVIANRQPWASFERYADALSSVEVADLADITKGCDDHAFISLKGPKDVVTAQLDEAGYTYEVVDAEALGDAIYEEQNPKGWAKHVKEEAKEAAKKAKKGEDEDEDEDDGDDD